MVTRKNTDGDTEEHDRKAMSTPVTKLMYPELSKAIVDAFHKVYRTMGHGFLEKVYENALLHELRSRGIRCEAQQPIHIYYEGVDVGEYYADILVDGKIILELKAAECITNPFIAQLLNYLHATGIRVGYLLNFGPKAEFVRRIV